MKLALQILNSGKSNYSLTITCNFTFDSVVNILSFILNIVHSNRTFNFFEKLNFVKLFPNIKWAFLHWYRNVRKSDKASQTTVKPRLPWNFHSFKSTKMQRVEGFLFQTKNSLDLNPQLWSICILNAAMISVKIVRRIFIKFHQKLVVVVFSVFSEYW